MAIIIKNSPVHDIFNNMSFLSVTISRFFEFENFRTMIDCKNYFSRTIADEMISFSRVRFLSSDCYDLN